MRELEEILGVAREAARAAAQVHLRHLGRVAEAEWTEKGTVDFVTHVDRQAEEEIVRRVAARFPTHAVLAEEGTRADGAAAEGAEWLWVVDPLDGTTNFLHGYPMFAVSIGVLHRGEAAAAVVLAPATGEEWTALRGAGAFRNGERVRVSAVGDLRRSLIGTGIPFRALDTFPRYVAEMEAVVRATSGVRRAGSAALDLCHVASGYFDGFWEHALSPWDFAAGVLLIREAGGIVTRVDGGPVDLLQPGSVLAGNPRIHALLGALIRDA